MSSSSGLRCLRRRCKYGVQPPPPRHSSPLPPPPPPRWRRRYWRRLIRRRFLRRLSSILPSCIFATPDFGTFPFSTTTKKTESSHFDPPPSVSDYAETVPVEVAPDLVFLFHLTYTQCIQYATKLILSFYYPERIIHDRHNQSQSNLKKYKLGTQVNKQQAFFAFLKYQ